MDKEHRLYQQLSLNYLKNTIVNQIHLKDTSILYIILLYHSMVSYIYRLTFSFYSYVILHSAQYNRGGEFFTYFINRLQIPQRDNGLPESTNKENSLSNKLSIPYIMKLPPKEILQYDL